MKKQRLVYGVGVNDADYKVYETEYYLDSNGKRKQRRIWRCPFYRKWTDMLRRCYSKSYHKRQPTYMDCSVCEEWLLFSNFKRWMESQMTSSMITQDWENKCLDKDLIDPDNKVYCPEKCLFVSQHINNFVVKSDSARGAYPLGVCWHKRNEKFIAQCSNGTGALKHLGYFDCAFQAHRAWQLFKAQVALDLKKEQSDNRIQDVLQRVHDSIMNDYLNNRETINF